MSEKEKEVEIEEEEREIVDHWSHEHPLTLVETRGMFDECYACRRRFSGGEKAYGCSHKCGDKILLDEECAGLPRKIRHAKHPQHILRILTQVYGYDRETKLCAIYESFVLERFFYSCKSEECMLWMHIRCAQGSDVMYDAADDDDEQRCTINHPSHPRHELRFLRRSCSFKCDACGITRRGGKSYICCTSNCQYWVHEKCASLSQTIEREDHQHPLSLSFHVPLLYIKYDYKCNVCSKYLMSKYWVYHCELCSYVVHISCAFNKSPHATRRKNDDDKGIMKFPTSDGDELIDRFLKRQEGAISILLIPDHDVDYKFHNHKLRLMPLSQKEEEENSDDDDVEDKKSELICDGCITPIFSPKERPSSSSSSSSSLSSSNNYYNMSCSSGCNYNLHLTCFNLPPRLSSIPLHQKDDHELILESSDKLPYNVCSVCYLNSNGLIYKCTGCKFKVDIKCASMPDTIYHTAHPQHPLNLHPRPQSEEQVLKQRHRYNCGANCGDPSFWYDCYACGNCDFIVHVQCAMLPATITSPRWDKHHPLPLTYNANLNHPGEFYCDECETEMNPTRWMYHCRHCNLSFHPRCFITISGEFRNIKFGKDTTFGEYRNIKFGKDTTFGDYRNIKFGKQYVNAAAHPHPLAFQFLTEKAPATFVTRIGMNALDFNVHHAFSSFV